MTVVLLALAAALAYALASVLQQRAAVVQPAERALRPAIVLALARQPAWLCGIAASGVGLVLQLLALGRGSLTVVQPVLVCGLVFALAINAFAVQRRALSRRERWSALAVTGGVALFLVAAGPGGGSLDAAPAAWAIVSLVIAALLVLAVLAARMLQGPARALVLACGAGTANALSAAFTKSVAHQAATALGGGPFHVVRALLSSWSSYALVASLAVVIVLVQSAFQAGPIAWSLPALTAVNPVASVLIGVAVLHERVGTGWTAAAGGLVGLAAAMAGVLALGASPAFTGARGARPYDGGHEGVDEGRLCEPGAPLARAPRRVRRAHVGP